MVMNKPIMQKQPIDADLLKRFRAELQQFASEGQRGLPALTLFQHGRKSQNVSQTDHQAETIEEMLSAFGTPASASSKGRESRNLTSNPNA